MRLITFVSLLLLSISCSNSKNDQLSKLSGNWIPIQQEIGGTALPTTSFQGQKLVISDSNYTFTAESVDKGVIRCSGEKMDIYGREGVNSGKHFTAIYKLENDQLTICYNLSGDAYPEAFDTKGKPKYFMCVFKKQ
ncbi:MAG TPA: TIGR03067 domain-containing protein [Chitinophagaceae bacterium]|nr:TIGR03067 domain-containing protein [Chitinophagaceae bacterium]